jgi:hypothetical protein
MANVHVDLLIHVKTNVNNYLRNAENLYTVCQTCSSTVHTIMCSNILSCSTQHFSISLFHITLLLASMFLFFLHCLGFISYMV